MTTPTISVQFPVPFPALVVGSGGITVTKSNGIYTISCVPSITAALAQSLTAPVPGIAGQMAMFTGGLTLVSAAMSGDATMTAGGVVTIANSAITSAKIAAGTITNANCANMPANTFKGNNTGGSAVESDLTVAQTQTALGIGSQMPGTTTNDSASAGNIGELQSATVVSGSATSLATGTSKTVTSISLTAGDWDITGLVGFTGGVTTTVAAVNGSVSATNNTLDQTDTRAFAGFYNSQTVFNSVSLIQSTTGPSRFSLNATTTIFLVANASFGVSTMNAFGTIRARRVR